MDEQLDPKELVTLEELAISNMWETAALGKAAGTERQLWGEVLQ